MRGMGLRRESRAAIKREMIEGFKRSPEWLRGQRIWMKCHRKLAALPAGTPFAVKVRIIRQAYCDTTHDIFVDRSFFQRGRKRA